MRVCIKYKYQEFQPHWDESAFRDDKCFITKNKTPNNHQQQFVYSNVNNKAETANE